METTQLAFALGVLSALTLALANFLVKRGRDILASRTVLQAAAALAVLPFAFIVAPPDRATWIALALSVPAHAAYQGALVRAMHRGDLSLVYPVMRGAAPLTVAFFAFILLRETLAPIALGGLALTVLGIGIFAWPKRSAHVRFPDLSALLWAGATALGIALYTVADANGVRTAQSAYTYIVWLFLLDWIALGSVFLITRRGHWMRDIRPVLRGGIAAGVLSVISYGAILLALQYIPAAQASAIRETSVLIVALLGWLFLGESFGPRRVLAAAIVVSGLILMRMG